MDGYNDSITIDRESIKSLSSETRIRIIKSLGVRRKTLTELTKEFGMSASSVKEHLEMLCSAGFIDKIDDNHKWKYYELTRKGKSILNPGTNTKIWILLGVSSFGLAWIFNDYMSLTQVTRVAKEAADAVMIPQAGLLESGEAALTGLPHVGFMALFAFLIVLSLGMILYRRGRKQINK